MGSISPQGADPDILPNIILHIEILDVSKPVVNRVLSVPRAMTFNTFHFALQLAFCWDIDDVNKPYCFKAIDCPTIFPWQRPEARNLVAQHDGPKNLYILREQDLRPPRNGKCYDSRKMPVGALFHFNRGSGDSGEIPVVTYEYDGWTHFISFVGFGQKTSQRACCLAGQGASLAKGCGGPQAWAELKRIYTKPENDLTQQDRDRKTWYESDCKNGLDIGVFPWEWRMEEVNWDLSRLWDTKALLEFYNIAA